ncbi:D-alanine--D-alanine ligase [Planctomonas sp. JC2975]|uniref:D-alanine--D-alanine ligase family protein n=1 Tax=Planctomonas sp. JC2975 TaxID=2729626 RepID=UPI0014748EAF|nr:D-alanine--D-alanine ligase family protein [Planctomonas sp. JC2975]NNC11000.1 D-alanine--D-alanine ligase [Planctomonas sp. JC2975]
MTHKRVLVLLFGGRSSEHSISCATARGVLGALDRDRYDVIPVGITRDGSFVLERDDPAAFALDPDALPEVRDDGSRVRWPDSVRSRELTVERDGVVTSLGEVDVVFPILHGLWGEDGTIQGLLELAGIPYVGSGVLGSALGMDKHYTKTVLQAAGIQVAPWVTVTREEWERGQDAVADRVRTLGSPLFVKPARAGSSVGVTKITSAEGLGDALEVAFAEDGKALVESAVVGREVEIGVLGARPGEAPRASVAGEIVVSTRGFYDFEAKYLGAPGVDLVCPADLTDDQLAEMQALAVRAFQAIDAGGLSRVDFFLTDDGWVINEVNTMPGFTPISMFPKVWQESGFSYPELIDELIDLALQRR